MTRTAPRPTSTSATTSASSTRTSARTSNHTSGASLVLGDPQGAPRRVPRLDRQVIPHITNEIKERIRRVGGATDCDIVIVGVGGTVGDIESLPFLEAIRQFRREVGPQNSSTSTSPSCRIEPAGELKTKPTQHSVKELRRIGIHPDIVVSPVARTLSADIRDKIALFADVSLRRSSPTRSD